MTRCRDCGASQVDEIAAINAGWWLLITGSFRCLDCRKALRAAGEIRGSNAETVDTLPPGSRGALPKSTAESILPPTVSPNPGNRRDE